ncbi:hypothetical protein JOF29_002824 [Kribbella aluminosa]|uniref:WYL domain-containing protein n=1 Tax=Kribbella aluminosa TaxID=416017 RepID=A0ABS4UJA8_9ACTN|nr:hypothetical protein [Kribbella aluminosa]MBP2351741.1 hypothetical protein [Kribbella aluminosa]
MSEAGEPLHRVCAWLGEYLIVEYVGVPASAAKLEDAIRRSFTTLRVTNEPDAIADYSSGSSGPSAGR